MTLAVNISFLGDKALERKLARLEAKVQKSIVRKALRESNKRLRPLIAAAAPVDTGALRKQLRTAKIRVAGQRGLIRIGQLAPDDPNDAIKLNALEYGYRDGSRPPLGFVRRTVDTHTHEEHRRIGRDIGQAIEQEAMRG